VFNRYKYYCFYNTLCRKIPVSQYGATSVGTVASTVLRVLAQLLVRCYECWHSC